MIRETILLLFAAATLVLVWLACFLCTPPRPPRHTLAERYFGYQVAKFRSYDQGLRSHPMCRDTLK